MENNEENSMIGYATYPSGSWNSNKHNFQGDDEMAGNLKCC